MVTADQLHQWTADHSGQPERLSTTVRLRDVFAAGVRLEADAFNIETRAAVDELRASQLPLIPLYGESGLCREAHNAFRFKRIYVDREHGVPFLSSSDIISMRPAIDTFLSRSLTSRLDELIIRKWDVLVSCSGTVGNVGLAGDTLAGNALSQHAIRIRASDPETAGFVTAFLRSRYGRLQLGQASYGSVVQHIEPDHLTRVLVPDLHPVERISIGAKVVEACQLRDQANELLDMADRRLTDHLGLPPIESLKSDRPIPVARVTASQLRGRLEANFHDPLVVEAETRIRALPMDVATAGDPRVTREIRPITRFRKRVYVRHGGIPLVSSKQLFQVDPVDVKGLAKGAHTKDLPEIALEEGMILITRSGTVGRVQIVPKYMEGWAGSEHATRFIAADTMDAGYLYAWFASEYGQILIKRNAYGSVIQEIDLEMFSSVPVPILPAEVREEIGAPVRRANDLRDQAWRLEQAAIAAIESRIGRGAEGQPS